MIRTGIGIDCHAFADGDGLALGGVRIPYHLSIVGHSDGDAVIHAIVDALLGAVGAGDIGTHFPSTDEHWHGADSTVFLKHAKDLLKDKGADINHIDCTVVLQEPQLADYILPMRQAIVAELGVDLSCVSIKATTTDYLGFTGRKEGLVTVAIATVDVPD